MNRLALLLGLTLTASACQLNGAQTRGAYDIREGQVVAETRPTPLYTAHFVIRGMVADADNLYVSGLRFADTGEGEGEKEGAGEPTGVIVKIPFLGVPETLAEGAFVPMTNLELIDGWLYWHERHDSPDGRGLRALSTDGEHFERISEISGHSWSIQPDFVYFTRPDDEIDEGGFYVLARDGESKPKLVARRRGVVRSLLASADGSKLYWITRQRRDGTWGVYEWDGKRSGKELLRSDETFASIAVDGDDFLWVTWDEDEGEPLHSLYRRPIAGGDTQVLTRKRGLPGFMEVFADDSHIYLTTVRGGELRRLPKAGGEIEILAGSGDREVTSNRFNLFWVDDQQVYWRGK
ncbi:hypothetical protein G6O69_12000 [Pseudenhygromyxa sp. WMMC2535]|uniref:TolB family protein n=1 Tax=Pseudenhygromyxa sp. WMMC2535 TaxID=2712867 RepID=UPI001551B393|nr:hypothetical protein [Pseudenhygromyxa sp. WMMC2535]NVB38555.1 hypothetical protein [Pseudenhygromyxa sp. WMMC2535]